VAGGLLVGAVQYRVIEEGILGLHASSFASFEVHTIVAHEYIALPG
jgi:hypothetical protein